MRSLFVMDPLHAIDVRGDSTYVTMRECCDRGYPVWYCTPDQLFIVDGRARVLATPVHVTAAPPHFDPGSPVELDLGDVDVVWMRKDPPFDMQYIFTTYILDMAPASTLVVNGSAGLKLFNEKLWVQAEFSKYQPPTLITNDIDRLRRFVRERPGRSVLKPWDGNGGRGVLVVEREDRNLNSMIELLSRGGQDHVIAQEFIPAVEQGDRRILLFDGEPVGAIDRVPQSADFRANMHAGASVERAELTDSDRELCAALRPALQKWGMLFVGIDVIDGYLTEINVTSPTGIQEINRLDGVRLEQQLVELVEARMRQGD